MDPPGLDGLLVTSRSRVFHTSQGGVVIQKRDRDGILPSYVLEAAGVMALVEVDKGSGGLQTGDEAFDRLVQVRGSADGLALLNHEVREALTAMVRSGGVLQRGVLRWQGGVFTTRLRMRREAIALCRVHALLRTAAALPEVEALLSILERDPCEGARIQAMERLVTLGRRDRRTWHVLERAIRATTGEVRLAAARTMDVHWLWTEIAADPRSETSTRCDALEQACRRRGRLDKELEAVINRMLELPDPAMRRAALRAIARPGGQARAHWLVEQLTAAAAGEAAGAWLREEATLADAAVRAVLAHQAADALPLLRTLVGQSWSSQLGYVLRGLGEHGDITDVAAITRMEQAQGVSEASRKAVARIQERAGDVGGGRLSLVSERGRLSEARDAGRLTRSDR